MDPSRSAGPCPHSYRRSCVCIVTSVGPYMLCKLIPEFRWSSTDCVSASPPTWTCFTDGAIQAMLITEGVSARQSRPSVAPCMVSESESGRRTAVQPGLHKQGKRTSGKKSNT
eukprot:scaffold11690_cov50-Phaeocystis_antarctica.AAC.1